MNAARGGAEIAHMHARAPCPLKAERDSRAVAQIDQTLPNKGSAIGDANNGLAAVFQIGDLHQGVQRQGGMRRRERLLVENLAIGGALAIKLRAIPRRLTGLGIARLRGRRIPAAVGLVGGPYPLPLQPCLRGCWRRGHLSAAAAKIDARAGALGGSAVAVGVRIPPKQAIVAGGGV